MKPAKLLILAAMLLLPLPGLARDEQPPDMEMLEFLGSYETARGVPIDPRAFVDPATKTVVPEQSAGANKEGKRRRQPEIREQKDPDDEK